MKADSEEQADDAVAPGTLERVACTWERRRPGWWRRRWRWLMERLDLVWYPATEEQIAEWTRAYEEAKARRAAGVGGRPGERH